MPDVRARSNAELLDATFEIYRRHFVTMATIAVVGLAPVTLLSVLAPFAASGLMLVYIPAMFVAAVFSFFIDAALVAATARAYFGEPVDVGDAWGAGLARPGPVLLSVLGKGLLAMLGFILLVVPGIIMLIRYFAVPATVVLENVSAGDGLRRSRELATGNKMRIFMLLGATWLFYGIVAGVVGAILSGMLASSSVVAAVINLLVGASIYPIIPIVTTLLYYDLRIRKEGYDIEVMAGAMNPPASSAV